MRGILKKEGTNVRSSSRLPTDHEKQQKLDRSQKLDKSASTRLDRSKKRGMGKKSNRGTSSRLNEDVSTSDKRALRGQNIFSQPLDMEKEHYTTPFYPKSEEDCQFIDSVLEDNFVFANLAPKERRTLIDAMRMETVQPGTVIITQGETGDYFYVVEEGAVDFEVNGNKVGSCDRGGSFGELALLYDCPRAATCSAQTECKVWKVDQKTFRYILANSTNTLQKDIHDVLRKVPFLSELDNRDLLKISDAFTSTSFPEGERMINKGDAGENFYIIREGTAKVHDIGFGDSQYVEQPIGPGDFFGERALLTGDPRAANITATSTCVCLVLSRETFETVLGPLQGAIDRAMKKRTLLGVPVFSKSKFQPFEMTRLSDLMVEKTFPAGTVLAEQGKPLAQNLYIIRSGKISVVNHDGIINTLKDADYFGDQYLQEPEGCLSSQTITVQVETSCGIISKQDIEDVIGNIGRLGQPEMLASNMLNKSIRFKDLVKVRILGVGTFGQVWLVNHKKMGIPYALKQLNKREIMGHRQIEGVMREKNIMASLEHPFVIRLVSTYQDEQTLYMLLDLIQGGELFSLIHTETRDGMPNGNARFYAACILEALSHLHTRSICYRDLKPENILIDRRGYCVLVDLGFAKVVVDKTYTLCGTPEYLAPEIIVSKGHDKGVDYWAFGVLVYEMIVGSSPFYAYKTDQVSLFKRIMQAQYDFPPAVVHEHAQDLIRRLLIPRSNDRLGCLATGENAIREHEWFNVIHVGKLLRKQFPTPWSPKIRDALDASHFDSYHELENAIPPKMRPLTTVEQVAFKDF